MFRPYSTINGHFPLANCNKDMLFEMERIPTNRYAPSARYGFALSKPMRAVPFSLYMVLYINTRFTVWYQHLLLFLHGSADFAHESESGLFI